MILLRPDCLVFKTTDGENVPCSAHQVTVEMIGKSTDPIDEEMVHEAAEAVLHYFKSEKGQHTVSVAEFSEALERALRGLGLDVKSTNAGGEGKSGGAPVPARVVEADLSELVREAGDEGELFFFPRLRDEVRRRLDGEPLVLRFRGLRACVKQLTGAKHWSTRCQTLNDHIVEYLRTCMTAETAGEGCALVVW